MGKKLWKLLFVTLVDGVLDEEIVKGGLSSDEAEKLQAKTVAENRKEFSALNEQLQTLDESIDSPEKRGQIKAVQNKLAKLKYPTKFSTFAIVRDLEAEAAAAKGAK